MMYDSHMKKFSLITLFLLITTVIYLGGCQSNTAQKALDPLPVNTPDDGSVIPAASLPPQEGRKGATVSASELASWKTYRNETQGFEVKYPPDWELEDETLYSPEMYNAREGGPYSLMIGVTKERSLAFPVCVKDAESFAIGKRTAHRYTDICGYGTPTRFDVPFEFSDFARAVSYSFDKAENKTIEQILSTIKRIRKSEEKNTEDKGKMVTIKLQNVPISFKIPEGYIAYHEEFFEGLYTATISIGKEIAEGYIKATAVIIKLEDSGVNSDYTPYLGKLNRYIESVYKNKSPDTKYTSLFGNKAVSYRRYPNDGKGLVGYIRKSQIPQFNGEVVVTIEESTYGRGVEPTPELFDAVVNSMRISN